MSKAKTYFSKQNIAIVCYMVISAFLMLMLATRSSFLYCINDWDDANSYFTLGKALLHGMVPYRDLFDQKGMYLYFFYGLAYLVSHTTFFGVFLLEIIEGTFTMFAFYKTLSLFVKKETALILTPFSYMVLLVSPAFYWGGCAEEMNLSFIAWGLFWILKYFKEDYAAGKTMDAKTLFLGGFMAGMIANIKFIDLGFYFAWMMCIFFAFLALKDVKGGFKACFIFLGGMALPFVPWFIYFLIKRSLYWWFYGTIYINVFVYSNLDSDGPGLVQRVIDLAKILLNVARNNSSFFVFVIPGVLWYMFGKGRKWLERFQMLALCFFLFLGIYVGGAGIGYYAVPLAVFAVLGFAFVGVIIEFAVDKIGLHNANGTKIKKEYLGYVGQVAVIAVCMVFIWNCSSNISFMSVKKEDHFLFKFKEIVDQTENPTVLNYRSLDTGLATVCDALPAGYWFQTQTLPIDSIWDEQKSYMIDGIPKFVICRDEYPGSAMKKYKVVSEEKWERFGVESTYYLLKRKDLD